MIERIAALGADYVGTLGALALTEATEDAAKLRAAARAALFAMLVSALGALWLNIAVLLWLMTTPWAIPGAFAIATVALFAGIVMASGARRAVSALHPMAATRRVLAAEIGGRDPAALHPPAAPMAADEASARLRAIRVELRETVTLDRGPDASATQAPVPARFEPRSRTMRTAMWVWRAIPRVPAGTAITGALGLVAVSSPRLRRLLAFVALLRNLGGHARQPPQGDPVPRSS
ncbi:MAG: hypothetical protein NTW15_09535 [Burkholderiales bacterium]|nr:hypothetical protein [Burkholderiales bacterium]